MLLAFVLYGAWRGLIRAVAGLMIAVLSLTGAVFTARELTPPVTELLRPVLESAVVQRVDEALSGADTADTEEPADGAESGGGFQADQLLRMMGWDERLAQDLSDKVEERVRESGASLAAAVVDSLTESFVHMVLLVLSFLALTLVLHLVAKALDLAARLPGVHFLNGAGGALVGLVQGVLVLFLAVWLLRWLHALPDAALTEQTRLLRFFVTGSPLDLLLC